MLAASLKESIGDIDSDLASEYVKSNYLLEAAEQREARRLQDTRQLLLKHENDELREELAHYHIRITDLLQDYESVQAESDAISSRHERMNTEMKKKSREIESLRAELQSLQDVSSDSTRLLTEKLALSREIASLKPEIEILRDQVAAQQGTLAEKLSLQRQLNTLQVELDNEKKFAQRVASRTKDVRQEDEKIDLQIEQAQAELAKERRERERAEREFQRSTRDLKSSIATLESRTENLQEKLKSAKDQVKSKEAELRASKTTAGSSKGRDAQSPRKRKFSVVDDDTMIGTPGGGPAMKRGKNQVSCLGEKSTFSLTPYLNRGQSAKQGSPDSPVNEHSGSRPSDSTNRYAKTDSTQAQAVAVGEPERTKGARQTSEQSRRKPLKARAKDAARLEQVIEEDREVQDPLNQESEDHQTAVNIVRKAAAPEKVKPRPLTGGLGKTLFDEGDEGPLGDRLAFGGSRRLGLNRRGLSNAKGTTGFGCISPLKKDRKVA